MKKILAILLCVALLLALAACGSTHSADDDRASENQNTGGEEQEKPSAENNKIDPFERMELWLCGKNGEARFILGADYAGKAYIDTPEGREMINLVAVDPENVGSLRNGDILHLRVDDADLWEFGGRFSRTEADVEIRGLNAYGDPTASTGKKTVINLNNYVVFHSWGLEGYSIASQAQVKIDDRDLLLDCQESLSENVAEEDLLGFDMSRKTADHIFDRYPPFEILSTSHSSYSKSTYTDIYGDFKNGEVVHLTWKPNEENIRMLQKVLNVEFVYEDFTCTIEGLTQAREVDVFEDYDLVFEGKNGEGTVSCQLNIHYSTVYPDDVDVWERVDVISGQNGQLSNGDKIILSIKDYVDEGYFLFNWDLAPTRTEIEVEVTGLE